MKCWSHKNAFLSLFISMMVVTLVTVPKWRGDAADHGDAPLVSLDRGADIGDVYFFLDPNDNSKVILAMDTHGFIVPAENANLGFFDPTVHFRFQIENTGDAIGDIFYDVSFTKQTSRSTPQVATIMQNGVPLFTAPSTPSSAILAVAPAPIITTDSSTGISFFAGLTDDPFFFDIPAELRYRNSLAANDRDPSVFTRARDSFAGYNVAMIVLSIPTTRLRGVAGNIVGLSCATLRPSRKSQTSNLRKPPPHLDRMGIPTVNTVLLPFERKDEYNSASTQDDAAGRFAGSIVATLQSLQTTEPFIGILARLAVLNGDILRLDLSIPNTGTEGGNNLLAAFPNGRRPGDDVIDTIVTLVSNGVSTSDNVNDNDVVMRDVFPFFASPTQPFPAGVIDDRTRN